MDFFRRRLISKADLRKFRDYLINEQLVRTYNEKTREEIVLNTIRKYMREQNISNEEQLQYFINKILYLEDECNKDKGIDIILGKPALVTLISTVVAAYNGKNSMAYTFGTLTTILIIAIAVAKKNNHNYYEEDVNCYLPNVTDEEKTIREDVKKIKFR